ncbi:hypothetical protein EON67_07170 [archaeon]|nr:MAG: hypothetical protein EON67_07170 [archaeon]
MAAFMRLRQAAVALPYPTLDTVLKGAYLTFVRNAKFVSASNASDVLLMANCVAELYGLDDTAAYQHAFVYLRQLALHLRSALVTKSKEALQAVYSWQYINCLRVWTNVLCRFGGDTERPLFQLLFPHVQLCLGVARLIPTPRFMPLRLHVLAQLTELSWSTGVYIPVLPLLLDMLRTPVLTQKAHEAAGSAPPALSTVIKLSKSALVSKATQDALVNRLFDIILDAAKSQYASVAFPEFITPVLAQLRAFIKSTRMGTWRTRGKALCDAFTAQAAKVSAKRAGLKSAPGDRAALAAFMGSEAETLKADRAKARAAAAEAARKEAEEAAALAESAMYDKKRKFAAAAEDEEDSDDDDAFNAAHVRGGYDEAEDEAEDDAEEEDDAPVSRVAPGTKRARAGAGASVAGKKARRQQSGSAGEEEDVVEDIDLGDL